MNKVAAVSSQSKKDSITLEVEDFDSWRISVQVLTPQDNDTESKLTTPDEEAKRTPSGKQSLQRKADSLPSALLNAKT